MTDQAIPYKYNEKEILQQVSDYVDSTYSQHYESNAGGKPIQVLELIIADGNGQGFLLGDIQKYASRYGKKDGFNRKDLMKIVHYGLLMLYNHDVVHGKKPTPGQVFIDSFKGNGCGINKI